ETQVLAATYVAPLDNGNSIAVYAVDTDSDVATIGTLSVLGAGRIYGARYIFSLPPIGERYYHTFSIGADYKDFEESIRLTDATDTTPIQYLNWNALYSSSLRSKHTSNTFSVAANFGVRDVQNDPGPPPPRLEDGQQFFIPGEFGFKRSGAKPNYFYLR